MGTIRKKGLAVCMIALLSILGMTVSAERPQETEDMENVETLSGGDAAGEQIMPFAAGDIASGTDGGITWTIDASGKLTVTGTGDLSGDHSSDAFAWKAYCDQITSAEVNVSGMTDASYLFSRCENMTSVTLNGFTTGSVTNMDGMFSYCRNLESLDVRGFDTSSVTSMEEMFFLCESLTALDLGSFNTTNVTNMEYMFASCYNLTNLNVGGFNTANVTTMANMFESCNSLVSLDVSGFNTARVTDMSRMFSGCWSLTNLDVSRFDTLNVVNMSDMFYECKGLINLHTNNFNTSNVTDMGGMFAWCSGLESLDLSNFDTRNVTSMYNMFYCCTGLTSLNISSFNTENVTSMSCMFTGCENLTSLDVSSFLTNNVTSMREMFFGCSGLESLDIGSFNTSRVTDTRNMFHSCSCLTDLDLSGFDLTNVVEAGSMFDGCYKLTTIQCPSNLTQSVMLPILPGISWSLPDGTEITELPQGVGISMVLIRSGTPEIPEITTTTPDLNMEDVVRVKYVPYSYTVETNNTDPANIVEFSVVEGRLAEGLQMYPATGEIYGVPTEAGEFRIRVMASYSNPAYLPSYADLTLTVLDNTDGNVGVATDPGYDITQPVIGFDKDAMAGGGDQTLVSQGEYSQFRAVYIDGRKLTEGQDYTSAPGSTRITIMNQTLADGGTGTHTLGIEFRTETGVLKRAAQNYVVSSKTDSGSNTGNNGSNSGSNAGNSGTSGGSGNQGNGGGNSNGGNSNSALVSVPTEFPQQDFVIYIVERGDSLWDIAVKFYGQGESWKKIYKDNAAVIRNPNRLYAGQKLIIRLAGTVAVSPVPEVSVPAPDTGLTAADATTYTVQKGDMLWSIAYRAYGDGKLWTVIYAANRDIIKNPERIHAGQVIRIPQR